MKEQIYTKLQHNHLHILDYNFYRIRILLQFFLRKLTLKAWVYNKNTKDQMNVFHPMTLQLKIVEQY